MSEEVPMNDASTGEDGYLVLAIDTSTDMLAVAVGRWVLRDGGADVSVLASGDHLCRRRANVELVDTSLAALSSCGHTMQDVDAVLVGRGPGSFTGVRIGIATAKGLACGLGCMLHGTSTLDAVAWHAWATGARGLVGVVGDAMRGEVYPGIYQVDDSGPVRTFPVETVSKVDAVVESWSARPDAARITLTGDGLRKYRDRFEAAGMMRMVDESSWFPTGEGLLRAAASPSRYSADETGDPALVLPVYTRLSDAEENEAKRLGLSRPDTVATTGCDDALADRHLQLRPMSVNDVAAVADLEREVFLPSGHEPWSEALFSDEVSNPQHPWWVAHDEGHVIGYAGGQMSGPDVEVTNVCVASDRRREGVAARLVARVAYDAQMLGATGALLEVEDGNSAAMSLYRGLGFEECGRRRDYYGKGRDAILMRADLPLTTRADHRTPDPHASIRPWPVTSERRSAAQVEAIEAAGDLVLAIESSCDETAMAVIDGSGEVISSVVATQIDFHARFGGVVPEIASRKHTEAVVGVYEEAMAKAGEHFGVDTLEPSDLAAVGVTKGPGLVGALVVGVAFAKGLAAAADLPLVGVNHLEGHLLANLFETPDLEPPFVASLVSGGHTMLVQVRDWGDYQVLGETIDDAVGEAFDKVAKALGLGYPGGPVISRLAERGDPKAIRFPRAMMHSHDYRFSLSGLKTAVITYIEGENRAGRAIDLPDLAASFEAAVIDVQVSKATTAVDECGATDFCVGGGVAANPQLRAAYQKAFSRMGVRVTVPPLSACTDNAAMIALVALRHFEEGQRDDLSMDADPNMSL
ncbi:MAG: tRNA (adenosine(37)-N6)-threonylcarbamoyltransferase complex transferase subunit TsaD [Atopobiaceae bacterium]|jgi:N6-L-threonylcarbamoyladenine synthase|nr:tRNA (adenosine(37)-N6)-threonylcarbamoyltransferase complex transferase subunit TsaD [Atopobiaceae bacterium]MCI2174104.1 tRNA (adenosine(37)-N6)-threonylcarbamoyltransferase complex transferase subunit TsaD [Atopobiaceae bacterium]MCI2206745.1 tRNA (adenosine(37)-N6)-threonylcarbamoyltransferase complex transferase subunit TsaD [Atopobiaceae bacterium]